MQHMHNMPNQIFRRITRSQQQHIHTMMTLTGRNLRRLIFTNSKFSRHRHVNFTRTVFRTRSTNTLSTFQSSTNTRNFRQIRARTIRRNLLVTKAQTSITHSRFINNTRVGDRNNSSNFNINFSRAIMNILVRRFNSYHEIF